MADHRVTKGTEIHQTDSCFSVSIIYLLIAPMNFLHIRSVDAVVAIDTNRPALGTFSKKSIEAESLEILEKQPPVTSVPGVPSTPQQEPKSSGTQTVLHPAYSSLPALIAAMTVEERSFPLSFQLLVVSVDSMNEFRPRTNVIGETNTEHSPEARTACRTPGAE